MRTDCEISTCIEGLCWPCVEVSLFMKNSVIWQDLRADVGVGADGDSWQRKTMLERLPLYRRYCVVIQKLCHADVYLKWNRHKTSVKAAAH